MKLQYIYKNAQSTSYNNMTISIATTRNSKNSGS